MAATLVLSPKMGRQAHIMKKEFEAQTAQVDVLEQLTEDEERERHRLEIKVERAFYEAGVALRQLRDKKLYRSTHQTFEEYCKDRFGYHRRHSYQLIDAAVVVENLCAIGAQKNSDSGKEILPTSERQVRPLTKLEPAQQIIAWQQAVESAGFKAPSGRIVQGIVERLKQKPPVLAQDFCEVGDVFILKGLTQSERKYNGCWAIAFDDSGINVMVDIHDGTLTVKPENLNPIDSPEVHRQLPGILKRIRRLRAYGMLDRCAYTVLESLGRQTYLTPLEEKFLAMMEQEYGIENYKQDVKSR